MSALPVICAATLLSACSGGPSEVNMGDDLPAAVHSSAVAFPGSDLRIGLMRYRPMPAQLYAGFPSGSTLTRRDGCLQFNRNLVVWPQDATWNAATRAFELEDASGSLIRIPLGGTFPEADLGGGSLPLYALSDYTDEHTLKTLRGCLRASSSKVTSKSRIWIIN